MKNPFKSLYQYIKNKFNKGGAVITTKPSGEGVIDEKLLIMETHFLLREMPNYLTEHLFKYNSDVNYWVNFIVAICYAESGYNRFTKYMEPAPLNYYSIGLLQLSYVDQNYHTFCDIQGDKIFNVANNLYCGIGILNKLVKKNGKPIFQSGHYWAVLKPNNKRHKVFLAKFNQLQRGV